MRIVARSSLVLFWAKHPEAEVPLRRWFKVAKVASWTSTAEVQAAFGKAKVLNGERVRFEIAGGNYRLVVAFDFPRQIAFVKFIGMSAEYDAIDALTVSLFWSSAMHIRPIRTDDDHAAALREIERL